MKHRIIAFLIIWLCPPPAISADRGTSRLDSISGNFHRTIVVASEPDYPPFCIVNEDGQADGFSVELIREAARVMNIEIEIKVGIWDMIRQDLAEGRIDALPMVGRTPEREELYDFTFPYVSLHGAIFVRKGDNRIHSVADLKDKEIFVMKGDNAEEYVRRHHLSPYINATYTFEEAFRELEAGKGDAVIIQRVMGIELLKKMDIKRIVPLDLQLRDFRQDFCFAVRKGDTELLMQLNEGLSIIIANKTFDELHKNWFGPKDNIWEITRKVMVLLASFSLLVFIISIVLLRSEVRRRTLNLRQEVAEHEKTLASLRKQRKLLAEMEKVTLVGAWEYDMQTAETTWSDGVYNIYGIPGNRKAPEIWYNILFESEEEKYGLMKAFDTTTRTGEPFDKELNLINTAGETRKVRVAGHAETDSGRVVRIYGSIIDITRQKKTEDDLRKLTDDLEELVAERTRELEDKVEKLRKSEKAMLFMVEDLNAMTAELKNERQKLESINRELEAFSYSVSHDLRAPLRGINGFTDILLEEYSGYMDSEGRRICSVIKANATKMGQLIDDLLSFSRLARKEMQMSAIDMTQMVQSVFLDLTTPADRERYHLKINKMEASFGDPALIRQVWINLISNALKFSSKKPEPAIEVSCHQTGKKVTYSVRDNGSGFDMRYKDKLFGVFQRLHSANEYEGTGVGLANVQRIVVRHGGEVGAEGVPGEGAVFWFTLTSR